MKGRGEEDGRRTVGRKRKEGRNIGRKQPPNKLTKATITNTFIFFFQNHRQSKEINMADK